MRILFEKFKLSGQITPADRERCLALLLDADPSQANVDDYLNRGDLYIARLTDESAQETQSGNIVGLYVNLLTRPRTIEIMNVAVTPELQGRGIGKQLVQHAIETARSMRAKTIEIGTGNSGVGQLALYQKAGFRIVGVDADYFVRYYEDGIYENGMQVRDMIRLSQDL